MVSRWIIDGRTDELREMLQELDDEEKIRKIEDWESKGSVLVDYFEIKFMIENIQKKAEVSHKYESFLMTHLVVSHIWYESSKIFFRRAN